MSRRRRPRLLLPLQPARPGAGVPRMQQGACQARRRQEGNQAGRRAASACARECASPECGSVCARVRVRVCALPPLAAPLPFALVLLLPSAPAHQPQQGWAGLY